MGLREKKRAKVRRTILDVCEELFRRQGFDETGIDEIIERSEISRQTFFNYFSGKEAVLTELGLEWLKKQNEILKEGASTEKPQSVLAGIRRTLSAQAEAIETDREFMTQVVTCSRLFAPLEKIDRNKVQDRRQDHVREIYENMASLIRMGQKIGEIRKDIDPDQTAIILNSSMVMNIRLWLTGYWDEEVSLEGKLLGTLDILEKGLQK